MNFEEKKRFDFVSLLAATKDSSWERLFNWTNLIFKNLRTSGLIKEISSNSLSIRKLNGYRRETRTPNLWIAGLLLNQVSESNQFSDAACHIHYASSNSNP